VLPRAMLADVGDIAIFVRDAALTVRLAVPDTEPESAVMVVVPAPVLVAKPALPAELLMVATFAAKELQCTVVVTSCVVPSAYMPVAVNCWLVPIPMAVLCGVTLIDTSGAAVTIRFEVPVTDPELAVISAVPGFTVVASPSLPVVLLMLLTVESLEDHVTAVVRSCVLPSE
jgi:hypothetical protein